MTVESQRQPPFPHLSSQAPNPVHFIIDSFPKYLKVFYFKISHLVTGHICFHAIIVIKSALGPRSSSTMNFFITSHMANKIG